MIKFLKLLCAFSLLLLTFTFAQQTEFFFNDFSKAGSNIILDDSAKLIKHGHDSIIQLTNTSQRVIGHAFYASQIKLKETRNGSVLAFSTAFTLGTVPEFKQLGGHGMAFVISPSKKILDNALPSQYLGLFNAANLGNISDHIFAVEFDTVKDFEYGDIDDNHIGIDLNSLVSNFSVPATYILENSTKVNVTMKAGYTIQAWVDYDAENHLINVTISPFGTKPRIPLISYKYDLSQLFEENMYVGFAASTGLLASSHYVLGWSFNMSGPAESLPMLSLPPRPNSNSSKHKATLAIAVSISVSIFLITVVFGVIYLIIRIRDRDIIEDWELKIGPHRYPYHELRDATRGFREKELLGRGGFGRVYKDSILNWQQRFRIVKGVASGLLYLHEGWEKVVIHRDIKASNVLLDCDFNGRLGDFGLARLHDHGTDLGTTRVMGTLGYIAPELSRSGYVTTSSDVFAFGALLLEVVCGRRPIEPRFTSEELVLVDWVWLKWNDGKVMEVVDQKLRGRFDEKEMLMVVKLGLMCSSDDPRLRPSMRLVVRYLDGEVALPEVLREPNPEDELRVLSAEPRHEDYVHSFATSSSGVSLQSYSTGDGTRGASGYASLSPNTR
ncbi:hypothetical protein BVRB_5g111480 [Beta vulgaris subsp. vulgaris]|nr:hypothetical protein BVRB_5g111480 [Beta vulgaris subsp. vulgaris]